MKKVEKKIWPEFFDSVESGRKTFELRINDFDIAEGDVLVLKEWDPRTKQYTGRQIEKKVGYVGKWKLNELSKFNPQEEIDKYGIHVISLLD